MPQCTSQKQLYLQPYGRGSLHSDLIDVTFKAHQRVNKINEGEGSRFKVVTGIMDRHQEIEQERQARVIARMRRDLEQFRAYQKVLDEYKVNNLRTLQFGYNPREAATPQTTHRLQVESRLYFAGFSMHALQGEVRDMVRRQQPGNRRGEQQQELLKVAKRRSDYMIDRRVTNEALRKERFAVILKKKKSTLKAEDSSISLRKASSRPKLLK